LPDLEEIDMLHSDLQSASHSRRLLAVAAIAATAATVVFSVGLHPQASRAVSLSAPVSSTLSAVWAHDDSVPNTADTLSHEQLADEDSAPTF
jgi:hypothetical protein